MKAVVVSRVDNLTSAKRHLSEYLSKRGCTPDWSTLDVTYSPACSMDEMTPSGIMVPSRPEPAWKYEVESL